MLGQGINSHNSCICAAKFRDMDGDDDYDDDDDDDDDVRDAGLENNAWKDNGLEKMNGKTSKHRK